MLTSKIKDITVIDVNIDDRKSSFFRNIGERKKAGFT
jgi:hypothetical protein